MKKKAILMITIFVVCVIVFQIGCISAERQVRIFDIQNQSVLRIKNSTSGYTREITESSPDYLEGVFATLQNINNCEGWKNRSIIRVYGTNATLQCTSYVPFPDGVYLSPQEFSVCFGKVIFWNSRFNVLRRCWESTDELCTATLNNNGLIKDCKKILMPTGVSAGEGQSFMWLNPTSVVVNACYSYDKAKEWREKIAIIDVISGDYRFLPFTFRPFVRTSFKGSLCRRHFAFISNEGEVVICDSLGGVCYIVDKDKLEAFGLSEPTVRVDKELTLSWDEGEILWVFRPNGKYIGIDAERKSIKKHGNISLGDGDRLNGLVQGRYAIIKRIREPYIIRSILGNEFFIKDIVTGDRVVEMPNCISKLFYLGSGLLLIEDL